ncbi:MAG: hypothetical protein O4859_21660, partial [Trichodesmium sp. St18_bin1]|nr:hypothetical protein [Trichodesmium sp. St18_bin1]MDE5123769.1 hypothetical protein [Trichodesmium sp. St19_bin1]
IVYNLRTHSPSQGSSRGESHALKNVEKFLRNGITYEFPYLTIPQSLYLSLVANITALFRLISNIVTIKTL